MHQDEQIQFEPLPLKNRQYHSIELLHDLREDKKRPSRYLDQALDLGMCLPYSLPR